MARRSVGEQLSHLAADERERADVITQRLIAGDSLSSVEILGASIEKDTGVYPIGLFEDEFLPLALATSPTLLLRMPCEFSFSDYEELLSFDFSQFLSLIDRGLITPIVGDYTAYADSSLIAPIVLERRPHIPEQRIQLQMLGNDPDRWRRIAFGLQKGEKLFPSHHAVIEEFEDSIGFRGVLSHTRAYVRSGLKTRSQVL